MTPRARIPLLGRAAWLVAHPSPLPDGGVASLTGAGAAALPPRILSFHSGARADTPLGGCAGTVRPAARLSLAGALRAVGRTTKNKRAVGHATRTGGRAG